VYAHLIRAGRSSWPVTVRPVPGLAAVGVGLKGVPSPSSRALGAAVQRRFSAVESCSMRTAISWLPPSLVLVALSAGNVTAANHNESVNGDLSNNGNTPTSISLSHGSNTVAGTLPGTDLDFLTIHVPASHQLTALTLVSYTSVDGTSFIGMKNGATIAATTDAATLNGYTHFGDAIGNVGQNILDDIGTGPGAIGFTPPRRSPPGPIHSGSNRPVIRTSLISSVLLSPL
jgi:hypothetical protein